MPWNFNNDYVIEKAMVDVFPRVASDSKISKVWGIKWALKNWWKIQKSIYSIAKSGINYKSVREAFLIAFLSKLKHDIKWVILIKTSLVGIIHVHAMKQVINT